MGTTSPAKSAAVTKKPWKAWQVLAATAVLALVIGYPAGMLFGLGSGQGLNCVEVADIGGCSFPNPFIMLIGFFCALPFSLSLFYFGFANQQKQKLYYWILMILLAKFLYVGNDVLVYEISDIVLGIAAGLGISYFSNRP